MQTRQTTPITLLLWLLLALAPLSAQGGQALLWQVESPQGGVSHLFGTIHSEDERVLALAPPVEQAFKRADTLVLEMKLSPEVQLQMAQAIMLPPSEQLAELLPVGLHRRSLVAMAERGYPEAVTERLRPWAIILTLSMPPPKSGQFLDRQLHDRALASGKRVEGLESVDEQLSIFSGLSVADQQALLRQTLEDYRKLPELMEAMTRAWLARDMQQLVALSEKSMQGLPAGVEARFGRSLVEERNHRMAERSLSYLEQGGAFIAVGALHLAGDEGLVALLRGRGMKVTPVY
jgi:uncharacterized protein YbaP (TraB family)